MKSIIATVQEFTEPGLRDRAVAAARGDGPFDILITGGTLVDVVTGELRPADIGIIGPLIASVHEAGSRSDAAEIVDASGTFISPGLIDTHMHIESSMVTPATYAGTVLPRGVTTVVWDPHEFGNVHGIDGVGWALDSVKLLPLRAVVLAPSSVPSAPGFEVAGADFDVSAIEEMLFWPKIAGLAEVMNMRGVIDREPRISAIVQTALTSEKLVCGHARGLAGPDLQAFMTAGVTSDHELVSGEDLIAKLRAGLTIELRGSHDHLLPEFVQALNGLGQLPQTVTLATDDVFPDDLAKNGGLDDVVRRLVRYGMKPEWALQAATLNGSVRIGRADLGLIAAGRRADIVLFEDLKDFRARQVFASGTLAARAGAMTIDLFAADPSLLRDSVKLEPLQAEDFRLPATGRKVRLATIDRPRFTNWGQTDADVVDGYVVPPEGATLIAVTHRHGRADSRTRLGFLTGWGKWKGAFATTLAHDSHNLTVFGSDPADMAAAANAVITAGGGMAVAIGGKIEALLPLPLSGLVSQASMQEVSASFEKIRAAMDRVVDWQPPYLIFKACFGATLACNAGPHQTDRGIADVATGTLMESPILEVLE
ncbi:adenine deaminase [Neorhizobium sp. R1-B]|uniref:adenine deaminase n=1 Tax=Neorhizobium TaxID=1525371 RepID=UPI0010E9E500|nr:MULTISPECIES: adenine deaminase C-terminal domain-containing protein [Neorhizobium]TCV73504.1 adenine deaminase [Neorhizobium sp. S3-V5DH]TDX85760.1 adenine deaminase [Neorhizobium sp. R1-B]